MARLTPLLLLLHAFLTAAIVWADERDVRIVYDSQKRPIAIEAIGYTKDELAALAKTDEEQWAKTLRVFVFNGKELAVQQIAGRYTITNDVLRFTPQFAFRPGTRYRATFFAGARRPIDSIGAFTREFEVPAVSPAEPTRVTAIYPSASTLPENQLRFYIHFSAPMAAGHAYEHVQFLKPDGTPDKRAFLEIGEEMWDRSGQRLTLLFDPGRVKNGLKPREEFGPVLEPDKSYRLVIDKDWRDANDQPLASGFEKRFTAGDPIEKAIDVKQWKIAPPIAGSTDALVVTFPRPLDSALLRRMLTITDAASHEIAGNVTLADDERRWEFRPEKPWREGSYNLVADTALEDTAGNNISRAFEVDVFERVDDKAGPEFVRLPFSIGAKK